MVSFCFSFNTNIVMCLISITAMSAPGTFIRVGLMELVGDDYFLIPSLIPNLVGCLLMGFHEGFAKSRSNKYVKEGIATGLAGCITTFSSFNFETNRLIISHHPDFASYFGAIAFTFIGGILLYFIGEFVASAIFRKAIAKQLTSTQPQDNVKEVELQQMESSNIDELETDALKPKQKRPKEKQEQLQKRRYHLVDDYWIVLLWTLVFVVLYGTLIPVSFMINAILWESLVMSPFGALTRWYLGKVLNVNRITPIPIGTLMVNVIGSVLFSILYVLSWDSNDVLWRYHELGLAALITGFCGCLTTVSSFVHETFKLKREATNAKMKTLQKEVLQCEQEVMTYKLSVVYVFLTFIISQILTSIINTIDVFILSN